MALLRNNDVSNCVWSHDHRYHSLNTTIDTITNSDHLCENDNFVIIF